jgi:SAM-dependent methyltransferase
MSAPKRSKPNLASAKRLSAKPEAKPAAAVETVDPEAHAKSDGYIPFKIRFQAWWDGIEPEALVRRGQKTRIKRTGRIIEVEARSDLPADSNWAAARVRICDSVWGEGFVAPGGAHYALDKVLPFPPGRDTSVLDLSAGLGGRMAELARDAHVTVAGLEQDAEFVDHAQERAARADRTGVLPIDTFNPERLNLRGVKYHCIVARELFFTVADKTALLTTLRDGLRRNGTLSFADFVLAEFDQNEGPVMEQWHRTEPLTPRPWPIDAYRASLEELGLETVHFEDDSEHYRGLVIGAWRRFLDGLDSNRLDRAFVGALMPEAEMWLHRMRALESGQLRLIRVTARHAGDRLLAGKK